MIRFIAITALALAVSALGGAKAWSEPTFFKSFGSVGFTDTQIAKVNVTNLSSIQAPPGKTCQVSAIFMYSDGAIFSSDGSPISASATCSMVPAWT